MKKIYTLISILSISTTCIWAQATPNPGMETWTHVTGISSYDDPNSWDTPNSNTAIAGTFVVLKATVAADIHSGSAAAKLVAKSVLGLGDAPGIITTGTLPSGFGGNITGGIAYTMRPDSITGWYKYTPVGGDKGFASLYLFGAGGSSDTIAKAGFDTPNTAVNTYTRFSAPMVYRSANAVANSIWIICTDVTNPITSANFGTTMFVDDLSEIFVAKDSIAITSGTNPACAGSSITFTATPYNGGTTPSYQWKVNGTNAGTNSPTFTTTALTNGQVVTCVMTSNFSGVGQTVAGSPSTSPGITMNITAGPGIPTITQSGTTLTSSSATGNQWYLNGTIITGATNQTYTATATGNYTVTVTATGCSTTSAPLNVTSLGIEQSTNSEFFTVSPNPSNGIFNLKMTGFSNFKVNNLEVFNVLGEKVYQSANFQMSGSSSFQIDLSSQPAGIYLISLSNVDKENKTSVKTGRLIIQK